MIVFPLVSLLKYIYTVLKEQSLEYYKYKHKSKTAALRLTIIILQLFAQFSPLIFSHNYDRPFPLPPINNTSATPIATPNVTLPVTIAHRATSLTKPIVTYKLHQPLHTTSASLYLL